ncbi:hypothetical protein ACFL5V_12810 [Fibrobacterota bacterium]
MVFKIDGIMKIYCILFITLLIYGCFSDKPTETTSNTETENVATIAGRLVDENDNPAKNAKVTIYTADHNPNPVLAKKAEIIDIVRTDDNGEFQTDSLTNGFYNVIGEGDGDLSFEDSVEVSDDSATKLPDEILKAPGSLSGVIRLQPNHDSRTVFILVFGTSTFTAPTDSVGNFKLENLAEGTYNVRILSTLDDYKPKDTTFTITSGEDETLPDTLSLDFTGIPVVTGLKIDYDSLNQVVTLTWNQVEEDLISGYHVYRKLPTTEEYSLAVDSLLTETTFVDNLSNGLEKGETYQYIVKAVDSDGNEGLNSADVTAEIAFYVDAGKDTTYDLGTQVVLKGQVNTQAITPVEYRWDADGDGTNELASDTVDSIVYVYPDTGTYRAVFAVDDGNRVYSDTVIITITGKEIIEILTTTVSGEWGPNKIYKVLNDIEVPAGGTLIVNPGTEVVFMGDYRIEVKGELISDGSEENFIKYTYGYDSGYWNTIYGNSHENISMSYSIIERSREGLSIFYNLDVSVHNCVFRYNKTYGIHVYNACPTCIDGKIYIYNNVFHDIKEDTYRTSAIRLSVDKYYTASIINNIILNCHIATYIDGEKDSINLILKNNGYYNNDNDFMVGSELISSGTAFSPAVSEFVYSDPKFISLISGEEDYNLQTDSPCKGTGYNGTDMGIYSTFDPASIPFIPQNLNLAYDTLKQIVNLSWEHLWAFDINGYNVYRKHSDSDFVKINSALVIDTIYSDSSAIQDQTYEYKITAVDKADNEGGKSNSMVISVIPAFSLVDTLIGAGEEEGKVGGVQGIVGDKYGNIYLAEGNTYRIQKFDSLGNHILTIPQSTYPIDLAIDSKLNLYVISSQGSRKVEKYDSTGTFIKDWTIDGSSSENPVGIAISLDDSVYVSTSLNTIQVFDTAGNFIKKWNTISRKSGIIIAPNDDIYICSMDTIAVYSNNGDLIRSWEVDGLQNSYLALNENGELFVACSYLDAVKIYDGSGNFLSQFSCKNEDFNCNTIFIKNERIYVGLKNSGVFLYRGNY